MLNIQAGAALAGIAAHLIVSPLIEPSTVKILLAYFTANIALLSYLTVTASAISFLRLSFNISLQIITLNTIFLLTATTITLLRRSFLSPLTKFPGPKLAALSKLWSANEYRLGRASKTYRSLHKEYNSDFIRTGPNEISISCVEAVEKVYKGRYTRGTFYEVGILNGEYNLNTRRDYKFHPAWRRIWCV
jgi:hypothetical protein